MEQYRGTWIQVDLRAIARNTASLRRACGDTPHMMAVVKANAYGHGIVRTAKTALANGADWLGVALPEEGEKLRLSGVEAPILVLGAVNAQGAEASVRYGLTQTVFDARRVEYLENAAARLGMEAQVHIKCDTGMGRIGVRSAEELQAVLSALEKAPHVHLTGAFTHFADADGEEEDYTRGQIAAFEEMRRLLPQDILFHAAASAAAIRYPEARYQMVRQGISLYGCPAANGGPPLEPALSWHTQIIHVKEIAPGDCIGYGCTFRAEKRMRVATLSVGYGDGYHRALSGKAQVLIHGTRCPVLGRICMDQMMADVSALSEGDAALGTEAVLLGRQGGEEISAGELAAWAGTISYEMLLSPNARVPVIYIE